MSAPLQDFHAQAADWRAQLNRNELRTRFVIITFILLYAALGLLLDVYLNSTRYPMVPLHSILHALLTLQIMPYITMGTVAIALVSLWITYTFHDKLMLLGTEYQEVTPETATSLVEKQLYNTVEEMKIAAGLKFMPRVFIINADYMNAFASGYSEKSAMVAITRGLLEKLDRAEMQAVMAHELSHIRHMDIKLTLMASVLANLMLMLIDFVFYGIVWGDNRRSSNNGGLVVAIILLRYLLPILTMILMLYLSRTREYMADAGCVELMRDNEPLARALLKIQDDYSQNQSTYASEYKNTAHESVRNQAYIFDPSHLGLKGMTSALDIFSTHPDISKRLEAIGFKSRQ